MRIVSISVAVAALLGVIFTQNVLAAETQRTNEKQLNINTQAKNPILVAYSKANPKYKLDSPFVIGGSAPVKSAEELKREAVLSKYKNKRESANYPEGKFTINASAYTAAADECGKSDGITASGLKVKEKRTLACPKQFPLGTKIKIDGYGTYVCEDRGGAIKGNHFDIYMQTKKEAFAFGRKNLVAEVVLQELALAN
jgi:3D (Asp-Asp-Asp) domain-containing protein